MRQLLQKCSKLPKRLLQRFKPVSIEFTFKYLKWQLFILFLEFGLVVHRLFDSATKAQMDDCYHKVDDFFIHFCRLFCRLINLNKLNNNNNLK
jgi:hypothetical protein